MAEKANPFFDESEYARQDHLHPHETRSVEISKEQLAELAEYIRTRRIFPTPRTDINYFKGE